MRVEDLRYELPEGLIARYPAARRDEARMMVVGERLHHRRVRDLESLLPAGALLVTNDTRVLPARLRGRKASGGRVEVLLVRALGARRYEALGRASRRLREGTSLCFEGLGAEVEREANEEGLVTLRFEGDVEPVLEACGGMPLPPYLGRPEEPADRERYQTVFAAVPGAVAAPTAGLHFTGELLDRLARRGVERASVTLHVGPGTFRPVKTADLDDHPMHAERFVVPPETAEAVAAARERGAPVIAVGTTVVRALESAASDRPGEVRAAEEDTRLMIQPGHRFAVVDALLTNFHLPESTLLALVHAFGGAPRVRAAYRAAIAEGYRFYSYGDAMFVPRGVAPTRRPVPTIALGEP